MMVASDTSVLVGLDRSSLLEAAFRLPFKFAVPDLLHKRELEAHSGARLRRLGLKVLSLDGDEVMQAAQGGGSATLEALRRGLQ